MVTRNSTSSWAATERQIQAICRLAHAVLGKVPDEVDEWILRRTGRSADSLTKQDASKLIEYLIGRIEKDKKKSQQQSSGAVCLTRPWLARYTKASRRF